MVIAAMRTYEAEKVQNFYFYKEHFWLILNDKHWLTMGNTGQHKWNTGIVYLDL